ncbi:MAG: hypothetical protein ACR652_10885 [Methylocystis sp.]|uniref:hypothetical protein n=1 Tax=Methylocystis sp. TaxID=1911079 RepID=UPI003DA365F5
MTEVLRRCDAPFRQAFHEAGHGIARIALGMDPVDLVLRAAYSETTDGELVEVVDGYAGTWRHEGPKFSQTELPPAVPPAPSKRALIDWRDLLPLAIYTAAGGAAERRVEDAAGLEPLTTWTAARDNAELADLARCVFNTSGRNEAAFLRLVSGAADRLMQDCIIWRAIRAVSDQLGGGLLRALPHDPAPGDQAEFYLRAADVLKLSEQAGLRPGAFAIEPHTQRRPVRLHTSRAAA